MPNSILSKQKVCWKKQNLNKKCRVNAVLFVLKQTCGLFGKPVTNWQHYLPIQITLTEVLMYSSKFKLLNASLLIKGYLTGMGFFFFCFPFLVSLSQIFTIYLLTPNTPIYFTYISTHCFLPFLFFSQWYPCLEKPCADFLPEIYAQLVPLETFLLPVLKLLFFDNSLTLLLTAMLCPGWLADGK